MDVKPVDRVDWNFRSFPPNPMSSRVLYVMHEVFLIVNLHMDRLSTHHHSRDWLKFRNVKWNQLETCSLNIFVLIAML